MEERYRLKLAVSVLVEKDGKVLVVREQIPANNPSAPISINQPGGHIDQGETIFECGVRETLEETGYTVKPKEFVGIYQIVEKEIISIGLVCELVDKEQVKIDAPEVIEAVWMSREEVFAEEDIHRSKTTTRRFQEYFDGVRLPLSAVRLLD
jgi:8-oxo-dGTP pyrophosphatase MutT (NUDIX family)